MDLPDNDVSSDDSETVDRGVKYRQSWDRDRFRGGPALRWLADVFVPLLLGTPPVFTPSCITLGLRRETGIAYYKSLLLLIDPRR